MGEVSKFLSVGQDFPPYSVFRIKVQGKLGQSTPGGCNIFFDILGKKGDTWHMILEYNPTGNCFVLRKLVLIKFFQVSHNSVTE